MRVLLCSLGSDGFLFPSIGLALALRDRGHDVAMVTAAAAGAHLAAAGIRLLPVGEGDGRGFATEHWYQPLAVALQVRQIELAMARLAPDLLVGQALTLGPPIVRERTGVPLAVQGLAVHLWPGGGHCPPASPGMEARRQWRHADMMRHLNGARALARLPAVDRDPEHSPLLGDLFLLRSIPELHGGEGIPGILHLVGACLWEPVAADESLRAWLTAARGWRLPLAYVHHGRTFGGSGFWPQLVEICARGGLAAAAPTDRMDTRAAGPLPPHLFVRRALGQGAVLPHVDLVIGSATSTAVLGALAHGVPCLLLPEGGEQLDLAEQVERAGAAIVLAPAGLTAARLQDAVGRVVADYALRRRARALQRALARVDGFALSAALLEDLAARSRAMPPATAARPQSREPA